LTIFSAIILLGILIFIHELGHFIFAKFSGVKVLKFSLGFGPKIVGKKIGDTEYMISAVPLGGYVKMLGEEGGEELTESEKASAFNYQPVSRRALIVIAGPIFNILLTFVIFSSVLSIGLPVNVPVMSRMLPVIDEVQEGYPAHEAGMQPADRIVKINEKEIDTWFDMVNIVAQSPGKELLFDVKRDKQVVSLAITPLSVEETDFEGNPITIGRIGVRKIGGGLFDTIQAEGLLTVPAKGLIATYKMGFFIIDSIKMLITGKVSAKNLGGPITILKESGRAASAGLLTYFMFMALLSVNLGILNLLPIPVLDGGHLLLFAAEAIKGKPISEKTIAIAQRIGMAFIIGLLTIALYNDILRLFGFFSHGPVQ
jgi:regulator of sigma E protease